ncbi:MAG: hypothetical protein ABII90_00485 [Bacteroidota bacterium]
MAEKRSYPLFLITAGGTGMRCLQAFVNACAIGMFPEKEVNILLLDTDAENKDKKNVENLIAKYKELEPESPQKEGYFSAKINLYTFVPDYSEDSRRRFTLLSQLEAGDSQTNRQLTDMFYEESVQEFDLAHGYRAQTHLGSNLMYHGFIEEIRKAIRSEDYKSQSSLYHFLNKINTANTSGQASVFVLGSTFGGTGASTIPIMPRGIMDSVGMISGGVIKTENIFFGAVILTDYFGFDAPSEEEMRREKVIADAQFFPYNTAAALMYYIKDKTILDTYKQFYIVGWPFEKLSTNDYKKEVLGEEDSSTITGGKAQENPAHVLEMITSFATKHFFDIEKEEFKKITSTRVKYNTVETKNGSPIFQFKDFIAYEGGKANVFKRNLHSFYSFCLLIQEIYDQDIENFTKNLFMHNYNYDLPVAKKEALSYFIDNFAYKVETTDGDKKRVPGWLPQMYYKLSRPEEFLEVPEDCLNTTEMVDRSSWHKVITNLTGNKNPYDHFLSSFKKINRVKNGSVQELLGAVFNNYKHYLQTEREVKAEKEKKFE